MIDRVANGHTALEMAGLPIADEGIDLAGSRLAVLDAAAER